MTCKHGPNDPSCSSHRDYVDPYKSIPETPDKNNYSIEEMERFGNHVVLKVKYPNCSHCSYEGNKVMVFLNITESQIIKWKKIDPHFRDPKKTLMKDEAPGPAARFPASQEGWHDACNYAKSKLVK